VEQEARGIVVGLPLSLDGSQGPAARKVNAFCARLRKETDLSVVTWDERMTTVEAHSLLREAGKSPSKARGAARGKIDSASAAIILDSYMQSN
jgi:putative Holliday junction resolvase